MGDVLVVVMDNRTTTSQCALTFTRGFDALALQTSRRDAVAIIYHRVACTQGLLQNWLASYKQDEVLKMERDEIQNKCHRTFGNGIVIYSAL